MLSGIRRIINLKSGEGTKTLVLFAQYFFIVAVTIAGKSAHDTFFLSRYSKSLLPLMFTACALAVVAASMLYSRLSQRMSAARLQDASSLLFAAGLVLLQFRLQGHFIPLMYIWVEIVIALIALSFWLSASEVFDARQAKRLFSLIGGGGALAAIVVGSGVRPFVKAFGPEPMLSLVAAAVLAQWLLGRYARRFIQPHAASSTSRRSQDGGRVFDSYLSSIAVVVALAAIVSQVVDYQFKILAAQAFSEEARLAGFFGEFYAITGAATLIFQFFLTSAILTKFGMMAGLLALPAFLSAGAIAVLLRPMLASAIIGKAADQTLKFTLNNSAMELLWLPVPSARRKRVRPIIGGAIKAGAEAVAGLAVYLLARFAGFASLSAFAIASAGAWVVLAVRLKPLYVGALVSALEKRQVDFDDLALDAQDPDLIALVGKALKSGDEVQALFALELIEGLSLDPWRSALRNAFETGSVQVKQRILEVASSEPSVLSDARVLNAISGAQPVALEAIRTSVSRQLDASRPILGSMLDADDPALRAAAAAGLIELGDPERSGRAESVLKELVSSHDASCRAAVLPFLANLHSILTPRALSALLSDPSRIVREPALRIVETRRDIDMIGEVIGCFEDPRTLPAAQSALNSLPPASVTPHLDRALSDSPPGSTRKMGILRVLARLPEESAVPLLIRAITAGDLDASAQAVHSLLQIYKRTSLPESALSELRSRAAVLLQRAYHDNRLIKLLADQPAETLLCRDLRDRIRQIVPTVLTLEMLGSRDRSLADAAAIASDGDPARLPLLLELLDNVLEPEKRISISPLVEPLSPQERDHAGARLFSDLPAAPEPEIEKWVYSSNQWQSAISLDHLWRTNPSWVVSTVNWKLVPVSRLTREMQALAGNQLQKMYSTLEKTMLLKSVSLFGDLPVEKLAKIAQVAEESRMASGAPLMREGELGDSLFIVADGSLRVHKGSQSLAILRKSDCVGEMALLDHAPRSADVTIEEDAVLLRIGREDFNEVTAANPEIMQGIVRLLVRRLREANEKLARQAMPA